MTTKTKSLVVIIETKSPQSDFNYTVRNVSEPIELILRSNRGTHLSDVDYYLTKECDLFLSYFKVGNQHILTQIEL